MTMNSITTTANSNKSIAAKFIRAGLMALVLGGSALAAMPAQAASPHVNFSFSFGNPYLFNRHLHLLPNYCLSDRQVRQLVANHGYSHIRFFDRHGRIEGVIATKNHKRYRVWVDTCTRTIVGRDRIH